MRTDMLRGAGFVLSLLLVVASTLYGQRPESVVVVNETDREALVWVDGVPRDVVPPDAHAPLAGVPEGAITLMATDAVTGRVLATESTVLSTGEEFTWTLYPIRVIGEEKGTGTVVLENALGVTVEVTLGGNEVAVLLPGATRVLPRVVAGDVVARAVEPGGSVVAEKTLTIAAGTVSRWTIGRD